MNKLVKGAIAGAAGIALLMGGAGTFAYWNSSAAIAGTTISSGNLSVTSTGAGAWSSQSGPIANISTYRIVPGDTLTFTKTVDIAASGTNLVATLGLAPGSIVPATASAADTKLASYLTQSATITASGAGITAGPTAGTYTVTGAAGAATATVTVTLTFPKGADTTNNDAKLGSVSLGALAVSLTQN